MKLFAIFLLAFAGMICGLYYTREIQPWNFCPAGIVAFLFLMGWLNGSENNVSMQTLKRLPRNADVVPIMQYTARRTGGHLVNTSEAVDYPIYQWIEDAPATSVHNFQARLTNAEKKNLQSFPMQDKDFNQAVSKAVEEAYGLPEYAVDGTVIGYKWLRRDAEGELYSPDHRQQWTNGHLETDNEPYSWNRSGIHYGYKPDSEILDAYTNEDVLAAIRFQGGFVHEEKYGRHAVGDIAQIIYERPPKEGESPLKFWTHWGNNKE